MKRSLPDARLCGRATSKLISAQGISTWAAACGLLSVLVLGCAGSLDPGVGGGGGSSGGGTGGATTDCATPILTSKCVPCHATGGGSASLDLQSANPGPRLVGKMGGPALTGGQCTAMVLLNAGSNPATGAFIDKITMATPPCGALMPFGGPMLPQDQITCLQNWATGLTTAPAPFSGQEAP